MLVNNLPILQVIIPLIGAPICALLASRYAWWWTFLVIVATWLCSVCLLDINYMDNMIIRYTLGGWRAPYGIEYQLDNLSVFFVALVTTIALVTMLFAHRNVVREVAEDKHSLFYAAFLLCVAGLLGIVMTHDVFNIYVFLEISSLATYALIAMGNDRRALVASFEYLILGSIGATFILIAVGLLYMMTGTLNITDLALRLGSISHTLPVKAAMAFFTIGLALKIAIFPLHLWLTNAYTNAPSFISSFLSATATKVGIYVLIRICYTLFGKEFSFELLPLAEILTTLGVVAMIYGSLVAVYEQNIKRMLAYSSVAQVGYIMVGIGLASAAGLSAALFHVVAHAITKAALFIAVGMVCVHVGGARLRYFSGLGRTFPWVSTGFVLAGLGLVGVPGSAGFVSKWLLLTAVYEQELWVVFAAIIISSLLALVYIWRVIEVMYFSAPRRGRRPRFDRGLSMVSLWGLIIMIAVLGIYFEPVLTITTRIVEAWY